MKKNSAPPRANSAARGTSVVVADADAITPAEAPAQYQLPAEGIHLAAIWRGPRDRSRAVQFALKEFGGHQFLDVRQYVASSGFMIPTPKGLTISIQQLGKFAAAAGKAHREAVRLGLTTETSS